ncbi:hypothetical protein BDW60DRAFT_221734 [Aspergillus nidulans var. acristatus]
MAWMQEPPNKRDPHNFQSNIAHQSSPSDLGAMITQSTLRTIAHLWIASTFLALAFDPLGIKYEVAADPPSVADGSSSMSVASVDSSDTSETEAEESGTPSDTAASGTASSNIDSETAESNTADNNAGELSTTESDADGSDNSESNTVSVAASGAVESEATGLETTSDTADSDTGGSDTTESNAAGSNPAEADSAESDADETEAGHTKTETTEAGPVLVAQTTIPYDSEFDLRARGSAFPSAFLQSPFITRGHRRDPIYYPNLPISYSSKSARVGSGTSSAAIYQIIFVLLVIQAVFRSQPPFHHRYNLRRQRAKLLLSYKAMAMFAALAPMQPVSNNPSNYPWTPVRPSPLSPRRQSTTAASFAAATTPTPQPQFQPPVFTFTPSPSPDQNNLGVTSPSQTLKAIADANANANGTTSPTPSSTYANRYRNTISNPLFAHSTKRTYISSASPRARSVRRNAFLNRVKQDRDNGRVEARAEQLAYMDDIAEQKEWAESMKKRAEEIQAKYGLGIEEWEGEDEYEYLDAGVADEAAIRALDEYIEQERAMEMALLEGVDGDSNIRSAGHLPDGIGHRANDAASSFSDEEYDNIFMDLVDHNPPEDMEMSG